MIVNFSEYRDHALLTYDANINVINNNTFDNTPHSEFNQAGIDLYHTYPNLRASIIGSDDFQPNQFINGFHSIFSDGGANIQAIQVQNNIIDGSLYGVRFDGLSRHEINNNDIMNCKNGTYIADNGVLLNTQMLNVFGTNEIGIYTNKDNSGYQFIQNCFNDSQDRDVRVNEGELANQGNTNVAASNFFSVSGNSRGIRTNSLNQSSCIIY